jgi:RNA polymerase sigma factor for flagellar operon FliA
MDFLPRIHRQRVRARDAAAERLRAQLQREPSDAELAAELGVSERRFRLRYANVHARPAHELDGDCPPGAEGLPPADGSCPMDPVDRADLIRSIQGSLRPVEWNVLRLHYLDGLSGKEVARRLRLSPARVCQIHGRVLSRLKAKLRGAV